MLDESHSKKIGLLSKRIKGFLKTPCFRVVLAIIFLFVTILIVSNSSSDVVVQKDTDSTDTLEIMEQGVNKDNLVITPRSVENFSSESPQLILVEGSTLLASTPPITFSSQVLGALIAGEEQGEERRRGIIEHTIKQGDTLSSLVNKFNVSLNTILWANNLNKRSVLRIDQKLIILPTSGVIHNVQSGDTISGIAQKYKAEINEIIVFNQLSGQYDIYIGDVIIVPKGIMPVPLMKRRAFTDIPLGNNHFILPVSSPYVITQITREPHGQKAVDFSHKGYACGRPIFAVAGGTVQRTGYHSIAGNFVRVLHPNGVVTFYGHLNNIFVSQGEPVHQGQIIGHMGNTGYTIGPTGCHLHFEVRGARNPFAQ